MSRKLVLPNLQILTNSLIESGDISLVVNTTNLDKAVLLVKISGGVTTDTTTIRMFACKDPLGAELLYEIPGVAPQIAAGAAEDCEILFTELPFTYLYIFVENSTDTGLLVNAWFTGKTVGA
jgi:hypothetical protein